MSPASDQPRIPVELFDAIMDYADAGTQATCSLSCRHWSPTARRHRFRMVHIQPRADSRPLSALLLCDPTSTVLPYVRELRIDEGLTQEYAAFAEEFEIEWMNEGVPWLDEILPTIRVHEFMVLKDLHIFNLVWGRLSMPSRCSLASLCQRAVRLELCSMAAQDVPCSFIIELLTSVTLLQHLSLQFRYGAPAVETFPTRSRMENRVLTLETFMVVAPSLCYLLGVLHAFPVLNLKKITLGHVSEGASAVNSFLRACAGSLENLTLTFRGNPHLWEESWAEPYFCAHGGVSANTSLRMLRLDAHLQFAPTILRQIKSPNLKHISLQVTPSTLAATDLDELADSLSTGTLSRTRPNVTFFCAPDEILQPDIRPDLAVQSALLKSINETLLTQFDGLREEGRLDVIRCVQNPETGEIEIQGH